MKCGINIILQLLLWYFYYGNGKSNRGTVIVVERIFSLAKTIVVDICICNIYTTNTAVVFFVMGNTLTLFFSEEDFVEINPIIKNKIHDVGEKNNFQ